VRSAPASPDARRIVDFVEVGIEEVSSGRILMGMSSVTWFSSIHQTGRNGRAEHLADARFCAKARRNSDAPIASSTTYDSGKDKGRVAGM
jgi:hypothetical protein